MLDIIQKIILEEVNNVLQEKADRNTKNQITRTINLLLRNASLPQFKNSLKVINSLLAAANQAVDTLNTSKNEQEKGAAGLNAIEFLMDYQAIHEVLTNNLQIYHNKRNEFIEKAKEEQGIDNPREPIIKETLSDQEIKEFTKTILQSIRKTRASNPVYKKLQTILPNRTKILQDEIQSYVGNSFLTMNITDFEKFVNQTSSIVRQIPNILRLVNSSKSEELIRDLTS